MENLSDFQVLSSDPVPQPQWFKGTSRLEFASDVNGHKISQGGLGADWQPSAKSLKRVPQFYQSMYFAVC